MKKLSLWIAAVMLAFTLILSGCGEDTPKSKEEQYGIDKSKLYGFFEPLWEKKQNSDEDQIKGFDLEVTIDLMQAMGCTSIRLMLPASIFSTFMVDYHSGDIDVQLDAVKVSYFHEAIQKLTAANIKQIIGEAIIYPPFVTDSGLSMGNGSLAVPKYGVDSCYAIWCNAVQKAFAALTAEFSELSYWEMGNETNTSPYMHPANYNYTTKENAFETAELAAVNVDYMYFASKGIRQGNSSAIPVTPGFTSNGNMSSREIEYFFLQIYDYIASGDFPRAGSTKSTESDDYFRALAWHPYNFSGMNESFISYNNDIYQVAIENGDEGKKVFFTEVGWYDNNSQATMTSQEIYIRNLYDWSKNRMWYVESCLYFRFYNCEYDWSGQGSTSPEKTFGVFFEPTMTDGFLPKSKADTMKEIFGGTGDLTMWSNLDLLNQKLS